MQGAMGRSGWRFAIALVLISCAFPVTPSFAAELAPTPKRVLVLYWYSKDFPANVEFERGLRDALRTTGSDTVEYFGEYLESNRFPGEAQAELLGGYLKRKYADMGVDAVVASSAGALEFLLRHRADLFADVPIVFYTFGRPNLGSQAAAGGVTGITAEGQFGSTLRVALDLHPATKEVLVVTGSPVRDKLTETQVRSELGPFESRVSLVYLSDLPLHNLMEQVKGAGDGCLILFFGQTPDEPGRTLDPGDVLALVAGAARVPVYAVAGPSLIGRGIVGGYAADVERAGALAGATTLRILGGTPPSEISIRSMPVTPTFDWRQLRRWQIAESRLPAGSALLFREDSFVSRYWREVGLVTLVLAAQLAWIGGLLVQRARRRRAEESLRTSEDRYRNVIESQTDLICRFLPDTTITFVNDAYCRSFNRSRDEIVGTKFIEKIPAGEFRDAVAKRILELRSGTFSHDHPVTLPDGSVGWQHWINQAIVGPTGELLELQGVGRDITDRKRAEEAWKQSEARNAAILRAIPDLMFVMRRDGTYLDYHARDENSLFVPPMSFLGKSVRELFPPALADSFMTAIEQASQGAEPVVVEYDLPIGPEIRQYEARLVTSGRDKILSIVRDITEAKRAQARNRELAGRLIASQETERQRIARDMHDDLSQKVALLNIDIDVLGGPFDLADQRSARMKRLSARAAEIATDLHELAHRLHPAKLQMLGLAAAVQSECRQIAGQHDIEVSFTHDRLPPILNEAVSLCLYRIAQESLHNVLRHSGARSVSVHLRASGGELTLDVSDNGVGFQSGDSDHAGLGLVSMRERVGFLGGDLKISSSPGAGTRVVATVPYDPDSSALAVS